MKLSRVALLLSTVMVVLGIAIMLTPSVPLKSQEHTIWANKLLGRDSVCVGGVGIYTGGHRAADTTAFTTTATRVAVYIPGATSSAIYAVSVRRAAAPGAGEFLSYEAKTDSLIIYRNTGTTSGLQVSYIRLNK